MAFCERCGEVRRRTGDPPVPPIPAADQPGGDRAFLGRIASQLYAWAEQSQAGGWSTHQVGPQRELADEIARHLVRTAPR